MSDLYTELKAFRLEQARALDQPAFCVFSNAVLDGLVDACPTTPARKTLPGSRASGLRKSVSSGMAS